MNDCIFCKIANGEIHGKVIVEDDKIIVFMDANPNVDGHCLIVPKKHYEDFTELDDEIVLHMYKWAKEITGFLMKTLDVKACTMSMNYGDSQVVKHVHLHILPNFLIETKPKKTVEEVFEELQKAE